jgi:hypothetical protein
LVVVLAPPNSTNDLDKSDQQSSYMSLLLITVIFLLLARGFSPTGRSSLRRTSDNDNRDRCDNGDRLPSESHAALAFVVVAATSSATPSVGHFRPFSLHRCFSSDTAPSSLTSRPSFSSSLLLM